MIIGSLATSKAAVRMHKCNSHKCVSQAPCTHQHPHACTHAETQEAAYGWLGTNYMTGKLDSGNVRSTVGTLEQGGGSAQEAFALLPKERSKVPARNSFTVRGEGVSYNLYAHSYNSFGKNAARVRMLAVVPNTTVHPCFAATGSTEDMVFNYEGVDNTFKARPVPQVAACIAAARRALNKSEPCGAQQVWSGCSKHAKLHACGCGPCQIACFWACQCVRALELAAPAPNLSWECIHSQAHTPYHDCLAD